MQDPNAQLQRQAQSAGERLYHFHGGLRLRHNKKISCQRAVERPPLPEQLTVPLLQHLGPPARALVNQGDHVLKGERIATGATGSVNVHAPTSGVVKALTSAMIAHPSGQPGECIIIESDGEDRWAELPPSLAWQTADPTELRQRIHQAGIAGLGGAVFPTGRKADGAAQSGIHTLVINGAECEPYISCDEMLMREQPGEIVLGTQILMRAVGAERAIIAIEDQMGAVLSCLEGAVRELQATDVDVIRIPTIYPEGSERQLIQVLTGLEVPEGGFPHDLGLLCQNAGTAAAVAAAVTRGQPLIERYVTVTGNGVVEPRNLNALIGTPIAELVAVCGGYAEDAARLVIGGPMMGYALDSDAAPVIKAANCILVLNEADIRPNQPEMPCIRCGECARVCPASLLPQELHFHLASRQWAEAETLGLAACIECGCCDFVCPSHIPLTSWFRFGKGALREQAKEAAAAELARQRFEAREARLQRAKAEKSERLARRKQTLKDEAERKRQVAASIARAGQDKPGGEKDS